MMLSGPNATHCRSSQKLPASAAGLLPGTGSSRTVVDLEAGPILSVFPALIVHSELKSVHPGFPVAFIF